MSDARAYRKATERALYLMSQGTCYSPGCDAPAIVWRGEQPISNLQIAHIRGARPGSPRFDPSMSDTQRAGISNLLLLCKPDHEVVDRLDPEGHPAEILEDWKTRRESSVLDASALVGVDEFNLESLLEQVAATFRPQREATIDLKAAARVADGYMFMTGPFEGFDSVASVNRETVGERVLRVTIRNMGRLAVSVTSIDLKLDVLVDDQPMPLTLSGRNDYPGLNPTLPSRVEDGERLTWICSSGTLLQMFSGAQASPGEASDVYVRVALATGESMESQHVPITLVLRALGLDANPGDPAAT